MHNVENTAAVIFWKNVDLLLTELNGTHYDDRIYNDSWLAANCGVTQASISLARSRRTVPKFATVEKIAEILRVSSSFLRTGERATRTIDVTLAEEVAKIPHFSELAKYILKMDASQMLELVYEAKMISSKDLE